MAMQAKQVQLQQVLTTSTLLPSATVPDTDIQEVPDETKMSDAPGSSGQILKRMREESSNIESMTRVVQCNYASLYPAFQSRCAPHRKLAPRDGDCLWHSLFVFLTWEWDDTFTDASDIQTQILQHASEHQHDF
eukprot:2926703-Amphidinium_carterae.1